MPSISIGQFKNLYEASSLLYTRMQFYQQRPDVAAVAEVEVVDAPFVVVAAPVVAAAAEEDSEDDEEEEVEEVAAAPKKKAVDLDSDFAMSSGSEDDEETLAIIAKKNAEKAAKNVGKAAIIAKLPVAYGIMKLRIICVIEDDKVALDDLIEAIEAFEDVQSVDIDAFNKL